MAKCDYCNLVEKGEKIFEDSKAAVVLSPEAASKGHVLVIPKEHFTILEQVPDYVAGHLFSLANRVSTAIFENLRVHGTNVIVENGSSAGQKIAHFAINVIPRSENDGLGFNWQSRPLSDDDMSTVELQLKEAASSIGDFEQEKKSPLSADVKESELPTPSDGDDYLLRQLRRLP